VEHDAAITAFLRQRIDEHTPADQAWARLAELAGLLGGDQ